MLIPPITRSAVTIMGRRLPTAAGIVRAATGEVKRAPADCNNVEANDGTR
jgi:hypothetical protein